MKTVGVDIISNDVCWVGIDGVKSGGATFFLSKKKVAFPTSQATEFRNLIQLKELLVAMLREHPVDAVAILRATVGCKPIRAKCEFIIELSCDELGIACSTVSPQTVVAADKKKIAAATGTTFDGAFNGGVTFAPGYLRRAAISAWCILQ